MTDRRLQPRMFCADLVEIQRRDYTGRSRRSVANLEDISLSGACLQVERRVTLGSAVRMTYPNGALTGVVKYCVFREIGYFLGIEFDAGYLRSLRSYRPQHVLDPRMLVTCKPFDGITSPCSGRGRGRSSFPQAATCFPRHEEGRDLAAAHVCHTFCRIEGCGAVGVSAPAVLDSACALRSQAYVAEADSRR